MPLCDPRTLERLPARKPPSVSGRDQPAVLHRARHLLPDEYRLVQLAVCDRVPLRRLSEILKLPAGTLSRRLQRISARLNDPVVISLCEQRCPLQSEYRQLGIEHFLQGRHIRELAEAHQMTTQQVRQMLSYIRGWHRGATSIA